MLLRSEMFCVDPYDCANADTVFCNDCGAIVTVADTNILQCESCGSSNTRALRCKECPLTRLDHLRSTTDAGRTLETILELDYAVTNFKIDWNDIRYEHSVCLRILRDERSKYQVEQMQQNQKQF